MDQTPAGGEIVALDTSGYGPFTINKAITISSAGPGRAYIGNVASGGSAITVSAGAGDTVHLRGLQIVGGTRGIQVANVGSLDISDVVISGTSYAALISVGNAAAVEISDSSFLKNGRGIDIESGSLVMKRVNVNGGGTGVILGTTAQILGCTVANSSLDGIYVLGGSAFIKDSVLTGNAVALRVDGGIGRIDTTTITGNSFGVNSNGGTVDSYGNNNFSGNGINTQGTITQVSFD